MLTTRRFWLGLAISVGFLFVFLWKVDFREVEEELRDGTIYLYLMPAVLLYFVALGFRSVRWHYLLLHLKAIPPWRLFPVVAIGYMSNNLLPIRLGELVRAHFLGEKEEVSKASGLATIAVERVLDGLTLLLMAAIIWPFLPWTDVLRDEGGDLKTWWVVLSVLVVLVFCGGFIFLFLLAAWPKLGYRISHLIASPMPPRFSAKAEEFMVLLVDGLAALRSPRKVAIIFLISAPVWLAEALVYYIIALAFDLGQPFQVILLVTATSNLATAVPSSIGGIGPFEVVAKSTLIAFGLGGDAAIAYVFFIHIITLWLPVNILGLIFLWRENVSLAQLARAREVRMSPPMGWDSGAVAGEGDPK